MKQYLIKMEVKDFKYHIQLNKRVLEEKKMEHKPL